VTEGRIGLAELMEFAARTAGHDLPETGVIAAEIMEKLRVATVEMEALLVLLEGEEAAEAAIAAVGLPKVE
jgi:type I restriction enzyme M protein